MHVTRVGQVLLIASLLLWTTVCVLVVEAGFSGDWIKTRKKLTGRVEPHRPAAAFVRSVSSTSNLPDLEEGSIWSWGRRRGRCSLKRAVSEKLCKRLIGRKESNFVQLKRQLCSALKSGIARQKRAFSQGLKSLTEFILATAAVLAMSSEAIVREGSAAVLSMASSVSPRSREASEWLSQTAVQCVVGAASFWSVCTASTSLQCFMRLHCGSWLSRPVGVLTVALASNASAASTAAAGFLVSEFQKLRRNGVSFLPSVKRVGEAQSGQWGRLFLLHFESPGRSQQQSERASGLSSSAPFLSRISGLRKEEEGEGWKIIFDLKRLGRTALRESLVGLLAFYVLGGRAFRLSPSSLLHPGAFASRSWSLPSLSPVAQDRERHFLKRVGLLRGCHSCGRRSGVSQWIADHQPPTRQVTGEPRFSSKTGFRFWVDQSQRLAKRFLRSAFGINVQRAQRLYPQCVECSLRQAPLVRSNKSPGSDLVFEWSSVRPYHLTGGFVALWNRLQTL